MLVYAVPAVGEMDVHQIRAQPAHPGQIVIVSLDRVVDIEVELEGVLPPQCGQYTDAAERACLEVDSGACPDAATHDGDDLGPEIRADRSESLDEGVDPVISDHLSELLESTLVVSHAWLPVWSPSLGRERCFAHADVLGGDLDELVRADEVDGALKRHRPMRCEHNRLVHVGGPLVPGPLHSDGVDP